MPADGVRLERRQSQAMAVSGRADPPLPLARLRVRGQLAELRAAELRFTTEEAAALLGAAGPVLPDTAVVALTARTEGWAAGLQLAALSLRGHPDAAGFVAAFSGSHRFVLDYLSAPSPLPAASPMSRRPARRRACWPTFPRGSRSCVPSSRVFAVTQRARSIRTGGPAGRSKQRIAHELVVALDTVKKHVTHILGKLGAANRTEAVARAGQLGLMP
jgi:ATP/maltotriose-dependent transcriptional regulator MalT